MAGFPFEALLPLLERVISGGGKTTMDLRELRDLILKLSSDNADQDRRIGEMDRRLLTLERSLELMIRARKRKMT